MHTLRFVVKKNHITCLNVEHSVKERKIIRIEMYLKRRILVLFRRSIVLIRMSVNIVKLNNLLPKNISLKIFQKNATGEQTRHMPACFFSYQHFTSCKI